MAKKSKYESLTEAVVRIINNQLQQEVKELKETYINDLLLYSEQEGDFNECTQKYPSIRSYIEKAQKEWIKDESWSFAQSRELKSALSWEEERIIEGKIALFTDEQLSNLTIEELASLVRS